MKGLRKAVILAVAVVMLFGLSIHKEVQADSIRISNPMLSLKASKTFRLKVLGTSKKVTWTSSDPSVVTVNKSGKVKAKKSGKATIVAKVGNKELICKVVVSKKKNKTNKFKIHLNNETILQ